VGVQRELATRVTRLHPARGAVEQLDTKLPLELVLRPRNARLGDIQPLRGAADPALLQDGKKIPQLTQVHLCITALAPRSRNRTRGDGKRTANGGSR
jgi:hypothetical protein